MTKPELPPSCREKLLCSSNYSPIVVAMRIAERRGKSDRERERKNLPTEKCLKGDNPVDDYHREQAARVAVRPAVGALRSCNGSTRCTDARSGYDQMQQSSDTSRALEVIIFIIIVLLLASVQVL